jgi:biopolymer transport protein ExbD
MTYQFFILSLFTELHSCKRTKNTMGVITITPAVSVLLSFLLLIMIPSMGSSSSSSSSSLSSSSLLSRRRMQEEEDVSDVDTSSTHHYHHHEDHHHEDVESKPKTASQEEDDNTLLMRYLLWSDGSDGDDDNVAAATTTSNEICDLECQNGGNCEIITQALDHNNVVPKICVCPPGYGGLTCQMTTSVCFVYLQQDRYCRNAAPCRSSVTTTTTTRGQPTSHYCYCNNAHTIGAFGGIECEYPATEYCTDDGSISWSAFCTNGGDCLGYVKNATEP